MLAARLAVSHESVLGPTAVKAALVGAKLRVWGRRRE